MPTTIETLPEIGRLSLAALDAQAVEKDWSEGFAEEWDVVYPTPRCGWCEELPADEEMSVNVTGSKYEDGAVNQVGRSFWIDVPEGYCKNPQCANFNGERVEDVDRDYGPIYNYYYPLPTTRVYDTDDADKLHRVSLCIVSWYDREGYALALTGCGMDMTWDIAEAFMRLGFLPPVAYCDLPRMAGVGDSEVEKWVIAGCKRSLSVQCEVAQRALDRLKENWG